MMIVISHCCKKTGRHLINFFGLNRSRQKSARNCSKRDSSEKTNRLSQIFLLTCIATIAIQLHGAVFSIANGNHELRSFTIEKYTVNSERQVIAEPIPIQRILTIHETKSVVNSSLSRKPPHSGRLRILFGILTADVDGNHAYRKRHRLLFNLWNDTRVCSLPDFKARPIAERYQCELIYTFVIGGNPNASPVLVDGSRPMEVNRPITGKTIDVNEPDMTILNIRENMNEGKSQTWMKYGAEIAEKYDLDYVAKCDADSLLHLHEFFRFGYKNMPPAPYNRGMYIGALRDKAYWPRHENEEDQKKFELYFRKNFDNVHLYVAGQLYIMSTDLAKYVGKEAYEGNCSYCEGIEDHDISTIAFHNPEPIKLLCIGRTHRFWEHPVKGGSRWKRIFAREQARVEGKPFEGRVFSKNSTLADALGPNESHEEKIMEALEEVSEI